MNSRVILNGTFIAYLPKESIDGLVLNLAGSSIAPNAGAIDNGRETISINELTFPQIALRTGESGSGFDFINAWTPKYQGIPLEFEVADGLTAGGFYLDLTDQANEFYRRIKGEPLAHKVAVKDYPTSFFQLAEGLKITDLYADLSPLFELIGYVIEPYPLTDKTVQAILLAIQLVEEIATLIKFITDSAALAAASLGTTVITLAVYIINVIIAVILYVEAFEALAQVPKFYNTIKMKQILETACTKLGYTFESAIFGSEWDNLFYIARTPEEGKKSGTPTNNPLPNITLMGLFNSLATMWNGSVRVTTDKKVRLDRRDYWWTLPPVDFTLQTMAYEGARLPNIAMLPKTASVEFAIDSSDTATYCSQEGTDITADRMRCTINYAGITRPELVGITREINAQIPFAKLYRKNTITRYESVCAVVYDLIRDLATLVGISPSTPAYGVGDRVGFAKLEVDGIDTDRLFIKQGLKVAENSDTILNSRFLWDNYYLPVEFQQWTRYSLQSPQPIVTNSQLLAMRDVPVIKDSFGASVVVEKNERDTLNEMHDFIYWKRTESGDFGWIDPTDIAVTYW